MRSTWGEHRRGGGSWFPFDLSAIPATRGLLIALAVVFLAYFFGGQEAGPVGRWVPFNTQSWLAHPWTLVTYPLLEIPTLFTIFTVLVLWSIGGSLERSWGSLNYLVLFFAAALVGSLAFLPAQALLGRPVLLAGTHLPLTAVVTAWAALDPEEEISFWGMPVRKKTVALVWVLLNFFQFGLLYGNPLIGFLSLAAPAAAWLYVRRLPRLNLRAPSAPFSRPAPPRTLLREPPAERERVGGFDPLRRRREQREIERLRRLLGEDDDDRPLPSGR